MDVGWRGPRARSGLTGGVLCTWSWCWRDGKLVCFFFVRMYVCILVCCCVYARLFICVSFCVPVCGVCLFTVATGKIEKEFLAGRGSVREAKLKHLPEQDGVHWHQTERWKGLRRVFVMQWSIQWLMMMCLIICLCVYLFLFVLFVRVPESVIKRASTFVYVWGDEGIKTLYNLNFFYVMKKAIWCTSLNRGFIISTENAENQSIATYKTKKNLWA